MRRRKKVTPYIPKYCDCCGVFLTDKNNKNGTDLCDRCDTNLEEYMKRIKRYVKEMENE